MNKVLVLALFLGRVAVEAAEIIVRSRRTLEQMMNPDPWRRPPWGGGGGQFWGGR